MKVFLGLFLAGGLTLAILPAAEAASFTMAPALKADQAAAGLNEALTTQVGWRRGGGYRRGHFRHARVYRPVRFHRHAYYRPAYYRPVRYRPVVVGGPVFVGGAGFGYGPPCFIRYRTVQTWDGYLVRKPVRVCRW